MQILDPVGADVSSMLTESAEGRKWSERLLGPGAAIAVTAAPVRFDDDLGLVERPVIAGELIVAVGFTADTGEEPTPLIVTVEVAGDAAGVPDVSSTAPPPADAPAQPRDPDATAAALDSVQWGAVATFAAVGAAIIALIVLAVSCVQRRGRRSFDR